MFRQKLWKYKNSAPKLPKKEQTLFDVPIGSLMISNGNYIAASCKYAAFNTTLGGGGGVGVCCLGDKGRKDRTMPYIYAHKEFVSDMDFNPFHDDILATGSYCGEVSLWKIPDGGLTENLDTPLATIIPTITQCRIENIAFNEAADDILAIACHDTVEVADLTSSQIKFSVSSNNDKPMQSMKWKQDGSLLVTTCKDGRMRVFDHRSDSIAAEWEGLDANRDSRCLWLGNSDVILGSGFHPSSRDRCVTLWDIRNCTEQLACHKQDRSHGAVMPFYDSDTNMLFICGKGDCFLTFYEILSSAPYLKLVNKENIDTQTVGMTTVPKRAMSLMDCEVNRLMQLTKNSIVPISYIVPRKSYNDFHADVYPETRSGDASMTAAQWIGGANEPVKMIQLQPSSDQLKSKPKPKPSPSSSAPAAQSNTTTTPKVVQQPAGPSKASMEAPAEDYLMKVQATKKPAKPAGRFSAARTSKYRYFTGTPCHKTLRIDNLKNLSTTIPGECDGIQSQNDLVALPLAGPGGQIAVFKLSEPGRLPDGGIPALQNTSTVLDFVMDPFDEHTIAVACDDGHIRVWRVPESGLEASLTESTFDLQGHQNRVNVVRYHPNASGVLASASHDLTVKIWNVENEDDVITLEEHPEPIIALAWHPDGQLLATACKDKQLRVFDPRSSPSAIMTGASLQGTRGARLSWAGGEYQYIIVAGYVKMSRRGICIFNSSDLSLIQTVDMDSSPAIMTMNYDYDTQVVLLSGKGDQALRAFEVQDEHPDAPLYALSDYKASDLTQVFSVSHKNVCDVKNVEFLRGVRVSKTYIESVAICVPRVKKHLFQDDIFPDTRMSWQPALTGQSWFDGNNAVQPLVSLKPEGMESSSSVASKKAPVTKKYESEKELNSKITLEQQKNQLIDSMLGNVNEKDGLSLPQDQMQGADDHEWDD